MSNILYGVKGTSLDLAFLKGCIDYVVDDKWNMYDKKKRIFFELYWRFILRKPFSKVCYDMKQHGKLNPNRDVLYIGDIFQREYIIPLLIDLGFEIDKNMFEAFDLSPKLCAIRRQSVTIEEIYKKDYEDDDLKLSIMANMIPNDTKTICDVGCGKRKLEKLIHSNMSYVGIDYIKRDENVIQIDLNKNPFPDIDVDCIFGCGILEFIDDVSELLSQFTKNSPKYILLSYSPREYSRLSTNRSRVYHNCIYSSQITSDICSKGYYLKEFRRYESRQGLYLFEACNCDYQT